MSYGLHTAAGSNTTPRQAFIFLENFLTYHQQEPVSGADECFCFFILMMKLLKKSITATVAHIAENMLEASVIFILQLNIEKFS